MSKTTNSAGPVETLMSLTREMHPAWGVVFPGLVMLLPICLHLSIIWEAINAVPNIWTMKFWGGSDHNLIEMIRNGGIIVVGTIGIWLAWRRVRSAESQATAADSQATAANETARFAELGHWSDRFTNAGKNLSSGSLAERCAGIAILVEIGREVPDSYRSNSVRMLVAFLQQHRRTDYMLSDKPFPIDCQTALDGLVELQKRAEIKYIDLAHCNLDKAKFTGSWSDINFLKCSMRGALFQEASFTSCRFVKAQLSGSFVSSKFEDCNFLSAIFYTSGEVRQLRNCTFVRCEFHETNFEKVGFHQCTFEECDWTAARMTATRFRVRYNQMEIVQMIQDAVWDDEDPPKIATKHSMTWETVPINLDHLAAEESSVAPEPTDP